MKTILFFLIFFANTAFAQVQQTFFYSNNIKVVERYDENYLVWRKTYQLGTHNKAIFRREEYYRNDSDMPYLERGYRLNGKQFYQIGHSDIIDRKKTTKRSTN